MDCSAPSSMLSHDNERCKTSVGDTEWDCLQWS